MRRFALKFGVFLIALTLVGCSYQYRLEREIYQAARKVRVAVAQADSLLENEYESLVDELKKLESKASERGLGFAVQRLMLELFLARGDEQQLEWLEARVPEKYRKRFYQDMFVLAVRHGRYDLALKVLDKVAQAFSGQEPVEASIPFLRCMVGVRSGENSLCEKAVEFYSQKLESPQAQDRFVGYQGLFFTYLAQKDKKKAIAWLEKMIFDSSLPGPIIVRALQQEIGLLARLGEVERLKEVLRRFREVYGSRMDDDMKEKLDKTIAHLETVINKQAQDETPSLSDR